MATLIVTEFSSVGKIQSAGVQAPNVPPIAEQTVTFTTSAATTNATNAQTRIIRVHTDADCHLAFGSSPTATTSNMRLVADQTEYFTVNAPIKVAAYDGTS